MRIDRCLALASIPEELLSTETFETLAWLERKDVAPPPVLMNRVLPRIGAVSPSASPVAGMTTLHRSETGFRSLVRYRIALGPNSSLSSANSAVRGSTLWSSLSLRTLVSPSSVM